MYSYQIKYLYNYVCFSTAIALILYWIYEYYLDEDLCVVDYKRYLDDQSDVYPTLSLCLQNSISDEKLQLSSPQFNSSIYLRFLKGEIFEPDMMKLNYRSVVTDLNDFAVTDYIGWRNGSYNLYELHNRSRTVFSLTYTGHIYGNFYSCYTLKIPKDGHMRTYSILMNNREFTKDDRTSTYGLIALMHYPNQLTLSTKTLKLYWSNRENFENFDMGFWITGAEVILRRNKRTSPCHEDWKNYDNFVLHESQVSTRKQDRMSISKL